MLSSMSEGHCLPGTAWAFSATLQVGYSYCNTSPFCYSHCTVNTTSSHRNANVRLWCTTHARFTQLPTTCTCMHRPRIASSPGRPRNEREGPGDDAKITKHSSSFRCSASWALSVRWRRGTPSNSPGDYVTPGESFVDDSPLALT